MAYLKTYVSKYGGWFLTAVLFLSLEAACDLFQPTMMSHIVDTGIRRDDLAYVLRAGGVMLLVAGAGACAAVVRNHISSRVSQRFGADLRLDLFCKIQRLPYAETGRFEPAALVTRLTNDVTQMQNFVNGMMRIFVKAPLVCVGSVILAVALDARLAVVIAAVVPGVGLVIWLSTKIGYPLFHRVQGAIDRLNGVMREYLSGVRLVRAFDRSAFETDRFSTANDDYARLQTAAMRVMAVFSPANSLIINLGIAAVLWFGGVGAGQGTFQVGRIIAFINYMMQISVSLVTISMVFNMFVRARASAERVGEVMRAPDAPPPGAKPPAPPAGSLVFEAVDFAYPARPGRPVLRGVSFAARRGETVGIVGATGSGKTSVVQLIGHFYAPTAGRVLVGGSDADKLDEASLRAQIAVVPQKNVLFSGTILENIRWGRDGATEAEVKAAARAAQAHEFISRLPEGYGTVLGQGGVNLSGGQKQRLAIARALLKKPAILVLDDCTSAVDAVTEQKIRAGLRAAARESICIVVAQRISAVADADRILVLDNGEVAGMGTHSALLKSCAVYREILRSQQGGEAET